MKTCLVCLGLILVALCGCSHTVVGGHTDSPDKSLRLWVSSHGASGKAYVDKSKKKLWVSIESRSETNSEVLFERDYILTGSDIEWDTRWSSNEAVAVVF